MKEEKLTLKQLRVCKKEKVKKLAEYIGTCASTVYAYENFRTYPSLKTAKKIAEFYEVTLNDIKFFE